MFRSILRIKNYQNLFSNSSLNKNNNRSIYTTKNSRLTQNIENSNTDTIGDNDGYKSQPKEQITFASLFRDSPYCQLGSPEGKIVIGEIIQKVGDDLYIDFGFKFLAVCRRPKQNPLQYCRGAKVKLRINDLELSDRFLGSSQDMTLLESDCTLLGLHSSPIKNIK